MLKILKYTVFVLILFTASFPFLAKSYVVYLANQKADALLQAVDKDSDVDFLNISKAIYSNFTKQESRASWLMKIRPYVTNKKLPDVVRWPDGAIELIDPSGMCDNAARMLKYVLQRKGYEAKQWNMVTKHGAHSALQVKSDLGGYIFLDPFYGYSAQDDGKLISAEQAYDLIAKGASPDQIFVPFNDHSKIEFYLDFSSVQQAFEGEGLHIRSDLPLIRGGQDILLGRIDGNDEDVKEDAGKYEMTPFWHYVGHKYNREWVRDLTVHQNIRLEMVLTQVPEEGIITSSIAPIISNNSLVWDLKEGQTLSFTDAKSKISWKRMNSFIGVDQIRISLLN